MKTITVGAVADIAFWENLEDQIRQNGFDWPFAPMKKHLDEADILFGNMESVLLPPDYPADEPLDGLVSRFDATAALKAGGFDFLCLANNHILDGGEVSMFHTQKMIEAQGIATGGIGRTQAEARKMRVIERDGVRVGFLCYGEDTNYSLGTVGACHAYYELPAVLEDIARNRREVDVLVVSIHADLEFLPTPAPWRRDDFRKIADAGATIVLGSHPHVPQGVEQRGTSLIAYSLGNFYFPAHSMPYMKDNGEMTGKSFLLLAEVGKGGVSSWRRVPYAIPQPPDERPVPDEGAEKEKALAYLATLDQWAADDERVQGVWREHLIKRVEMYQAQLAKMSPEEVVHDLMWRLPLVPENRWIHDAMALAEVDWERQRTQIDLLHRPWYRILKWKKGLEKRALPGPAEQWPKRG